MWNKFITLPRKLLLKLWILCPRPEPVKVKKETLKHSCTYFSVTIHKMNALNGDTFSASPRIPCHLFVKKLEGSLLCWTPILSQMNPINTLPPNCQKIHSNLILASVPRSSEWSLLLCKMCPVHVHCTLLQYSCRQQNVIKFWEMW